jgi:Ca2+-binding RTX toxin-like protein
LTWLERIMAIVTTNLALNMQSIVGFSGVTTGAGPTTITIVGAGRTAVYEGQFSFDALGNPLGTLRTYTQFEGSTIHFRAEGLDVSANTAFSLINAGRPQDVIALGLQGTDVILGSSSNDVLLGYEGNDFISARGGNDVINGGPGIDTALFALPLSSYAISSFGSTRTVAGPSIDGVDTLIDVERLEFRNGTLVLDVNAAAGQVYRLYQAAFARTPDSGGLGFWIEATDNGFSLLDVARNFVASAEFGAKYGSAPNPTSVVSSFYSNVLGRTGDPSGVAFWVGEITRGAEPAQILRQFAESPENAANVNPRINSGIWLDNYYFIP